MFHPPGTIVELDSKRVTASSSSSMLWRYGKYINDIQTRGPDLGDDIPGTATEHVKGEIFRHQIYEGITPSGGGLLDTVADSKNYDFEFPKTKTTEQLTTSFGTLISPLLTGELKGTV